MSTLIRDGPAPFSGALDPEGNNPDSDFTIRCGDGVDLHAYNSILQFVSGREFPETCAVLYRLLFIVYPGRSLEHYSLAAQNIDGVWAVNEAANRYHLFMGVQELLETILADPVLLEGYLHRITALEHSRVDPAAYTQFTGVEFLAIIQPLPRLVSISAFGWRGLGFEALRHLSVCYPALRFLHPTFDRAPAAGAPCASAGSTPHAHALDTLIVNASYDDPHAASAEAMAGHLHRIFPAQKKKARSCPTR
ncbi:hypothetical protein B0H11DRAFT_2231606 [Mycena galericulata]|nr:hypothetical protein B0H11DRAFT_2231606 [Mycena galericulata]